MNEVILYTYERNGYDDSDFFAVLLNTETNSTREVVYATTRGHIEGNVLANYTWLKDLSDSEYIIAKNSYKLAVINEHLESKDIEVGDIVRVIKGRKYPLGNIYKVTGNSEYRDRYGRVLTRYYDFDGGRVDINNVELSSKRELNVDVVDDIVAISFKK